MKRGLTTISAHYTQLELHHYADMIRTYRSRVIFYISLKLLIFLFTLDNCCHANGQIY